MKNIRKKVLLIMFPLIFLAFAASASVQDIGFGLDIASAQDLFLGRGSIQITADARANVSDEFQLRVPVSVTFKDERLLLETGLQVVYYPWHEGPFMSLSLFQLGFSHNCETMDNIVSLNEVILGWTFEFGPGLFVEPSLVIRDPSGTFSDEYSSLKGAFPCYAAFRGRLVFGWYFWR